MFRIVRCFIFAVVYMMLAGGVRNGLAEEVPTISGHPIEPNNYRMMVEDGFLPLRPEMTDMEIAEKLNLDLPQLSDVKSAVEKNDARALEQALAEFLNTKIKPYKIEPTGKPVRKEYQARAKMWLSDEYEHLFRQSGQDIVLKYKLGERTNWWSLVAPDSPGADGNVDFSAWPWAGLLEGAYTDTGDPEYQKVMLTMARSFYHNCRPPAKRMTNAWSTPYFKGPWHALSVANRVWPGHFPMHRAYMVIGNYPETTDTDRVMFLKLYWENTDYLYGLTETRHPDNFELQVCISLIFAGESFPEFRDSSNWLNRAAQRYAENMRDTVLDDGISCERTVYSIGCLSAFMLTYRNLSRLGATIPDDYKNGLEKMTESAIWLLAPTNEYPMFGHGSLGPYTNYMEWGAEIFPNREDFAYAASLGKKGKVPVGLTRVFPHTGWLTMRSTWSPDALYMAMNYNSTPNSPNSHCELLSFNLWANGEPLMISPGTPISYADKEYSTWCSATIGKNTVMVDDESHELHDNTGRLENWVSLSETGPGFTYLSAISKAYRRLNVTHRRAVLFIRPGYWFVYDTLTGDGNPHTYSWLGHFQPTELTMNPVTKSVATAPQDGNRLWLVPARPDTFKLEHKTGGPIQTRQKAEMTSTYISLTKSGVSPESFAILLYPSVAEANPPVIESLDVKEKGSPVPDAEAVGVKMVHGISDDLLVMAVSPVLRKYGSKTDSLVTDGESAYVSRSGSKLISAGLVGGNVLEYNGKRLIEAEEDITGVYLRYAGDKLNISAEGSGDVSISAGKVISVTLNGNLVQAKVVNDKVTLKIGSMKELTLSKPVFSTKPETLCKAIGFPIHASQLPLRSHRDMVVVTWQTSLPSDALIEYCMEGDSTWLRTMNPVIEKTHRFVLGRLENGKNYKLRITCRSADGRIGKKEEIYTHIDP